MPSLAHVLGIWLVNVICSCHEYLVHDNYFLKRDRMQNAETGFGIRNIQPLAERVKLDRRFLKDRDTQLMPIEKAVDSLKDFVNDTRKRTSSLTLYVCLRI